MYNLLLIALLVAPSFTFAYSIQSLISGLMGFFDAILIPFILGIAFLIFIINAIRYFVFESGNTEGQENARNVALYSIGAFVFILSFWGIVNIMNSGIGFENNPCMTDTTSDYILLNDGKGTYPCQDSSVIGDGGNGGFMGGGDGISTTTLPDPGANERIVRDTNIAIISATAANYYNSDFETLYGVNKDIVANTLYKDLVHMDTSATDLERLRGAYRLSTQNKVTGAEVTSYLESIKAYNVAIGHQEYNDTITYNNASNIVVTPLPDSVIAHITTSKTDITNAINTYNASIDMGTRIPANTITRLFDTNLTTAERVANFNSFMISDFHTIMTPALRDAYLQNINTENAFAGKLTDPQI